MIKFNQQETSVKIAIIMGISLILSAGIYATINSTVKKTDTTRCVEAYLEEYKNDTKMDAYIRCKSLLKR